MFLMCGIAGVVRTAGGTVDPQRIRRMASALDFRGPDGEGAWIGEGASLGHRRLSIIDLSDAGRQPMHNEDGSIHLVANGEIYNFAALRAELELAGHVFTSHSDSEVLIHGYEEWGLDGVLARIRGMYAFAIVDERKHEVHLARDPLGKKPLFFQWRNGELSFASTTLAIAAGLENMPEIDLTAVHDLLWHLYIPAPRTIFHGIEKVLPGHVLTFNRRGDRRERKHWSPDFLHPIEGISSEAWLSLTEDALLEAVRRRFISDVPVGVLLSGGVDSSLITALAARAVGRVKTFSVASQDPKWDESRFARIVADHCGTEHQELAVRGSIRSDLTALVSSMGEPLGDASAANLYAISKLARRDVKVVLSGDGGDEVFGGYSHYWGYYHAGRLRSLLPAPLRPRLASAADWLRTQRAPIRRAGSLLRMASAPVEESYRTIGRILVEPIRSRLFTPRFSAALAGHDPTAHYVAAFEGQTQGAPVDRVMQVQMQTLLPDDYLAKADLATMAVGLEARSPFLDLDVVELAMRIPARIRFRKGEPKGLLRELARRHVPPSVIDREKQGFVAPVGIWIRDEWPDLIDEFVLGPHVERRGWFNRDALERMVREHRAGEDRAYLLWTLLVLEMWLRIAEGTLKRGDAV
jgi:asparagine synthase (glutamine-hydrolysing)